MISQALDRIRQIKVIDVPVYFTTDMDFEFKIH